MLRTHAIVLGPQEDAPKKGPRVSGVWLVPSFVISLSTQLQDKIQKWPQFLTQTLFYLSKRSCPGPWSLCHHKDFRFSHMLYRLWHGYFALFLPPSLYIRWPLAQLISFTVSFFHPIHPFWLYTLASVIVQLAFKKYSMKDFIQYTLIKFFSPPASPSSPPAYALRFMHFSPFLLPAPPKRKLKQIMKWKQTEKGKTNQDMSKTKRGAQSLPSHRASSCLPGSRLSIRFSSWNS